MNFLAFALAQSFGTRKVSQAKEILIQPVLASVTPLETEDRGFQYRPGCKQGDQIGRNFAYWVTVDSGQFFENYRRR
jgi:hypothetical protein